MYTLLWNKLALTFAGCEDEFARLVPFLAFKLLQPHEQLGVAGVSEEYLVFVNKGSLRRYYTDLTGSISTIEFYLEGSFVAEIDGLKTGADEVCCIEALEKTELIIIGKSPKQIFELFPWLEKIARRELKDSYNHLVERVLENTGKTAEAKYLELLEKHPDLFQRMPLQIIASYIGICPQSLSRIRSKISR